MRDLHGYEEIPSIVHHMHNKFYGAVIAPQKYRDARNVISYLISSRVYWMVRVTGTLLCSPGIDAVIFNV